MFGPWKLISPCLWLLLLFRCIYIQFWQRFGNRRLGNYEISPRGNLFFFKCYPLLAAKNPNEMPKSEDLSTPHGVRALPLTVILHSNQTIISEWYCVQFHCSQWSIFRLKRPRDLFASRQPTLHHFGNGKQALQQIISLSNQQCCN